MLELQIMTSQIKPIFLLCFAVLLLQPTLPSAQEVDNQRDFDYLDGSERGPEHWGDIKKEWETCKYGKLQSPIDMSNRRVRMIFRSEEVKRRYKPGNATIRNRGHDIALQWVDDAGFILINRTSYALQQLHWHSPSEHTINGRRYDMEMHMVHISQDSFAKNKIAVVGFLYKIGSHDAFLSKVLRHMKHKRHVKHGINIGVMDPELTKIAGKKYYRYIGSLTVPPCAEGVIWTLDKKIRTVARHQVELLRDLVHDYAKQNARPLQPINNRDIKLFWPRLHSRG